MDTSLKHPLPLGEKGRNKIVISAILIGIGGLIGDSPVIGPQKEAENGLARIEFEKISSEKLEGGLILLQENSLLPFPNPADAKNRIKGQVKVVITGYSSTEAQTDSEPFITAAGTWVRDGIVANNQFPMGTKIRIPELYGDKIFVVEDRMSKRKGDYHIDIWFSTFREAKNFGAVQTYIEILGG